MKRKIKKLIRRIVFGKKDVPVLDVAIEIGASEKSIYKWVNGESLPSCEHFLALLKYAGAIKEETLRDLD